MVNVRSKLKQLIFAENWKLYENNHFNFIKAKKELNENYSST